MGRLIEDLKTIKGLKIVCPNPECEAELLVSRLEIADMYANDKSRIARAIERYMKRETDSQSEIKDTLKELETERREKPKRVKRAAVSVNIGKIVEKIVPSFGEFPYQRGDCRALFEPIDYVIFNGLSRNKLVSIEIVDVKTGNAQLAPGEREIKAAVEAGKVTHEIISGGRE
jgi:predicted Holliday junction resolvase-like endonuclease